MNNTRTMKISPRLVMSAGAVLAIACSDPVGPCDGRYACQVEGVDIAVLDVEIVAGSRIGLDPVTQYPVYGPGEMTAIATIVNRGDSTAIGIKLSNGTTIPELAPGETFHAEVTRDVSGIRHLASGIDPRILDVESVFIHASAGGDVDPSNDYLESDPFHAAIPVISASVEVGGQTTELRANAPFVTSFSIRNHSVHGAALDSTDVVLCMIDGDVGCRWSWPYFGRFELPRVEANVTYANAYLTSVPPGATVWPDEVHEAGFGLCFVPRTHDGAHIPSTASCQGFRYVTVRPDYSACTPPVAQIGVPLTLPGNNCQFPDRNSSPEYSVIAFDAVAGQNYSIAGDRSYQIMFTDIDGNRRPMPVATSGRYFLILYHRGEATITLNPTGPGNTTTQ